MANGWDYAEQNLIARLLANIPSGFTSALIKLPNASSFTTPSGSTGTKWLRVTINGFSPEELDAQGAFELNNGIMTIDVFYALGSGSKAANQTADALKLTFNGYKFQDIICNTVNIYNRGETENWWRVQVDVNFQFQTYNPNLA